MLRLSALIVATTMAASPVLAQQVIRPGQSVEGELTTSDPALDDGSHYDCFLLQTRSGQTVQIDQSSGAFDSFLTVGTGSCASPTNPESDDDSGGGLNARLVRAGDGDVLIIRVNSLEGGKTGAYRLTVAETVGGSRTANPGSSPSSSGGAARIQPGQTIRGDLTASDPTLSDGSHYDCFQLQTRRGQSLQIDQTSIAFDSYLSIGSGGCASLDATANDDDGGGGLNSRLVVAGDGNVMTIRVNSVSGGETGAYQLSVSEAGGQTAPTTARSSDFPTPVVSRRNNSLPLVANTTLPEAPTCQAVYMAMDELSRDPMGPGRYGNVGAIDYGARATGMRSRVREGDPRVAMIGNQSNIYRRDALTGVLGIMVDGEANGGEDLARVLALVGDCDRVYGFTPATTY